MPEMQIALLAGVLRLESLRLCLFACFQDCDALVIERDTSIVRSDADESTESRLADRARDEACEFGPHRSGTFLLFWE